MKEGRRTVILRRKEGEKGAKKEKGRRILIQRKKEGLIDKERWGKKDCDRKKERRGKKDCHTKKEG